MPVNLGLLREIADDWPAAAILRTVNVPNPNVGTDWTTTVPGESVWGVLSIVGTLTTSAAVANRVPTLRVTDGTATQFRIGSPVALTASLATVVSWLPELGYSSTAIAGASVVIGLQPLYVASGQVIAVTTTAIDVADQWSGVALNVVEVYHGHAEAERERATRWLDALEAIPDFLKGATS